VRVIKLAMYRIKRKRNKRLKESSVVLNLCSDFMALKISFYLPQSFCRLSLILPSDLGGNLQTIFHRKTGFWIRISSLKCNSLCQIVQNIPELKAKSTFHGNWMDSWLQTILISFACKVGKSIKNYLEKLKMYDHSDTSQTSAGISRSKSILKPLHKLLAELHLRCRIYCLHLF
jgi:hypothetical protein